MFLAGRTTEIKPLEPKLILRFSQNSDQGHEKYYRTGITFYLFKLTRICKTNTCKILNNGSSFEV